MKRNRMLIIGGSDAGISAALRAREIDPEIEATVVVADRYPNFSICGLPFYLSGEVADWQTLAHRTAEEIEKEGIRLLLEHRAISIDPSLKTVTLSDPQGQTLQATYDRLVIGTGAVSVLPPMEGLNLPGVFTLRTMDDSFAIHRYLNEHKAESAVVIGGGYIGMEMADALTYRGLQVAVVEYLDSVLTTVDPELGGRVREELIRHGVDVQTGVAVERIAEGESGLAVTGSGGYRKTADLVLVAVGSRPDAELAKGAGVETGIKGAIKVDRRMQTNIPDVYAAGDCVETWHRILNRNTYLPLGTTAHKQGRIAGENAAGGSAEFQGSLGTQSVKIFDLVAARTGLRDHEAKEAGFNPITIQSEIWDHKVYYPGASPLFIRITGNRESGRLLGAQILGSYGKEVSKRIDVLAASLYHGMNVEDLNDLDLSYTPPLSSPYDPVQMAAQAWYRKRFSVEQ